MTVVVPTCCVDNCNKISRAPSGFCEHHAEQKRMDVDISSVAVTFPRRRPGRPRKKPKSPLPSSKGASRTRMGPIRSIQSNSSSLNVSTLPPAIGSLLVNNPCAWGGSDGKSVGDRWVVLPSPISGNTYLNLYIPYMNPVVIIMTTTLENLSLS